MSKNQESFLVRPIQLTDYNEQYVAKFPSQSQEELHHIWEPILTSNKILRLGIFEKNLLIGAVSLVPSRIFLNSIEYTRAIKPEFQGRGLGTSVLQKLIAGLRRLLQENPSAPIVFLDSSISPENVPSWKSAQKAGMIKDERLSYIYYAPLREGIVALPQAIDPQ